MRQKLKVDRPDPREQLGECEIGTHKFALRRSLSETLKDVDGVRVVLTAYRILTGDSRTRVEYGKTLAVVQGAVQEAWYKNQDLDVPERCIVNQQRRIEEAMSTETEGATPTASENSRKPKIATVIREGLLAEKSTADILVEVQESFPDSAADNKTIAYYRHQLRKQGLLAKREKKA